MRYLIFLTLIAVVAISQAMAGNFEVNSVTLVVKHRVYKDFREVHTVKLGERFYLSDTDYSAEAVEFIPDFAVNMETGEVISRSDQINNPAVKVVVYRNDEKVDEMWAFRGKGAPHFFRTSLLIFELQDYKISRLGTPEPGGDAQDGNRHKEKEGTNRNEGGPK